MRLPFAIALSVLAFAGLANAQTSRERAVAIDRIELPPAEDIAVEAIGPELRFPWSLAFLPDGSMLVTEKHGGLRLVGTDGSATPALEGGPPNVLQHEDSGLLDVVLDPDFATNHLVYLAFVEGSEEANRTAIWKARLEEGRLQSGHVIFRSNTAKRGPSHPGGRMLFLPDRTLLLTVGDGYDFRDAAQDPTSHLGKVLRLTNEGGVPPDNPFVGRAGYAPEVWTLGHRNIQGLTRDSATGLVWSHEHGPRGGDEINLLEPGRNYGWPRALWGIDYTGSLISDRSHIDGMEDPRFFWAPSVAPSGLAIYHGGLFPDWEGKLLVGALAARGLVILRQGGDTGLLIEDRRMLTALHTRIRDIRVAPGGQVFLLTDDEHGRIWRLTPGDRHRQVAADSYLSPLAFLVGTWSGESRFRPVAEGGRREIVETSTTNCQVLLEANHLRCTSRFVRGDGRARIVEHTFNRAPEGDAIHATVVDDRWPGYAIDRYRRDPVTGTFESENPYETEGRSYVERVSLNPADGGTSVVLIESLRPADGSDWFETFRWTLRRTN